LTDVEVHRPSAEQPIGDLVELEVIVEIGEGCQLR
jgi:hypothetical protein